MNIIYMHHYGGSIKNPKEWRPYYLGKGFLHHGADVAVITASYHHMQKEVKQIDTDFRSMEVDGIKFIWIKVPKYVGNGVKRILNMFSFGWRSFWFDPVKKLGLNQPDLIIASSVHPFHVLAAIRWGRKYKAKVFFEVRDPWPLSLNKLLGLSVYHPFSVLLKAFQYIGHRFTHKTISLAPNLEPYMLKHGLRPEKYIYASNGIHTEMDLADSSILDVHLQKIRSKYTRIIMYTGSLGIPNAMNYVVEAFNQVDDDSIALVVIGDGKEKVNLVKQSINANCYFFDPIKKSEIQRALSFSDICILSWNDVDMYKFGVSPNKIFDYMWAAKPIIQAIDSPRNHVELGQCGVNVSPENPLELKQAILEMARVSDLELKEMGLRGNKFLLENFTYTQLAKKILDGAVS